MKRILILVIIISASLSLSAQDLIVTSTRDSINCKVTKVDQDNIYYTLNGQAAIIPLIRVKSCLYNYYIQKLPSITPVPEINKDATESESLSDTDFKHFRFALSGGYGYRTYSISDGLTTKLTDYYNKLRWGLVISADATYFFSNKGGIGVQTSLFKSSNSLDDVWLFVNGFLESGKIADDITIIYVGPSYTTRLLKANDWNSLLFTVSAGYTRYINNAVTISDFKLTSNSFGFSIKLAYDRAITKGLALGIQGSINGGSISKLTEESDSGTTSYYYSESLVRFDLGVGIRF
ncbi:MAG TPA: hypothetical protein PLR88_11285 [Bacteroidales bacterium]|nr:hypothetical protein [Bacteroidales bacterium]